MKRSVRQFLLVLLAPTLLHGCASRDVHENPSNEGAAVITWVDSRNGLGDKARMYIDTEISAGDRNTIKSARVYLRHDYSRRDDPTGTYSFTVQKLEQRSDAVRITVFSEHTSPQTLTMKLYPDRQPLAQARWLSLLDDQFEQITVFVRDFEPPAGGGSQKQVAVPEECCR
ncbi:MAG: hypothetical protein IBJ18_14090 [Phycisphaerales bacterium]|nr:hypothetical protein [Phycisphaerales bacterium]